MMFYKHPPPPHRRVLFHRILALLLACFLASAAFADGGNTPVPEPKKPLPADFPSLHKLQQTNGFHYTLGVGNLGYDPYKFKDLLDTNRDLLRQLDDYTPESVSAEFSRRMAKEPDIHMKLLLAWIAAKNGDADAAKFIQSTADSTDYETIRSRLSIIGFLISSDSPPDWAFDAACVALKDHRKITGSNFSPGSIDIAWVADSMQDLIGMISDTKKTFSVPILIDFADGTDEQEARHAVDGLGHIDDPRAVPTLLALLTKQDAAIQAHQIKNEAPWPELSHALGGLKARDAVPILLRYINVPQDAYGSESEIITELGRIGDKRAMGPLENVVAAGGKIPGAPKDDKKADQERAFAARIALISLEDGDRYPKWFALLDHQSPDEFQRCDILGAMADQPDPRGIPRMLNIIETDPSGDVVSNAIYLLHNFKYKTAASALIGCFDISFKGRLASKYPTSNAQYANEISDSLKQLTGQDFGPDKAKWQKWWKSEGKNLATLK